MKLEPNTRARLVELVGSISETQEHFIAKAMQEQESGVWRVAQMINARIDQIHSPMALFMKNLSDGAHRIQVDQQQRSRVYAPAPRLSPEEVARFNHIAGKWRLIQSWMHHPEVKALFHELKTTWRDPDDPTNEEGRIASETLVFAIGEISGRPTP